MKRVLSLCLAAVLALSLSATVFASEDVWGEYTMTNDGYGYLTANFPAVYPAEKVVAEGTQVVSDKTDAILLTMTETEKQSMVSAFAAYPVVWSGAARMGIPAVAEGEPVAAEAVFTSFDPEQIAQSLTELALSARAAGANALRLEGLELFPEALAESAAALFEATMNENGIIALNAERSASYEPSADLEARAREILTSMGAAGYLQFMQVSRDGQAALDMTPPTEIVAETIEYKAAAEPGEYSITLPESAKAGQSFEIVVTAPADVMSAMLRDENGENLNILDMLKENLGDSLRFTFTLQYDAALELPIYLYTMTTAGWGDAPETSAVLTVR